MTYLIRVAAGALIATGLAFSSASAAEHKLKAVLTAAAEVPPNSSKGEGTAEVVVNDTTKEVSWTLTFKGLTGDAVAAHIHGPAVATENGPVEINFGMGPIRTPTSGKQKVTDAVIADILAGKTYVNVHTVVNNRGEIRGQLKK